MKPSPLKVLRNEFKEAEPKPKEHIKRTPPKFDESDEVRINFWNPCIKWRGLERVL